MNRIQQIEKIGDGLYIIVDQLRSEGLVGGFLVSWPAFDDLVQDELRKV